jgi:hypothetical protein
MEDKDWNRLWVGWVGAFAVIEGSALISKNPKAPLCHFLRTNLGITHKPMYRRAGQIALGAGLVWLIAHLYEVEGIDG